MRRLPQFRIALNSRCGRACFYCRPSGEAVETPPHVALDPEMVTRIARHVRSAGICHVKLTGGDPALYEPLEEVVARLSHEVGFEQVEVISRHPRIADRAAGLVAAGATQLNLSIDTLDAELHRRIVGIDDHAAVLRALDACVATGVPCKVNVVVMAGINEQEIPTLVDDMVARGVRVVKLLDVIVDLDRGSESFAARLVKLERKSLDDLYVPLERVAAPLFRRAMSFQVRHQGDLGHPMKVLTLHGGAKVILKDGRAGAWYGPPCSRCRFFPCHDALMAMRLTADARLQICLLRKDLATPLLPLLDDDEALGAAIRATLRAYAHADFHPGGVTAPLEEA